jgi:hypothetical protein
MAQGQSDPTLLGLAIISTMLRLITIHDTWNSLSLLPEGPLVFGEIQIQKIFVEW